MLGGEREVEKEKRETRDGWEDYREKEWRKNVRNNRK